MNQNVSRQAVASNVAHFKHCDFVFESLRSHSVLKRVKYEFSSNTAPLVSLGMRADKKNKLVRQSLIGQLRNIRKRLHRDVEDATMLRKQKQVKFGVRLFFGRTSGSHKQHRSFWQLWSELAHHSVRLVGVEKHRFARLGRPHRSRLAAAKEKDLDKALACAEQRLGHVELGLHRLRHPLVLVTRVLARQTRKSVERFDAVIAGLLLTKCQPDRARQRSNEVHSRRAVLGDSKQKGGAGRTKYDGTRRDAMEAVWKYLLVRLGFARFFSCTDWSSRSCLTRSAGGGGAIHKEPRGFPVTALVASFFPSLLTVVPLSSDVYVNMIQRETVVPQQIQDELYPGFDRLVEGQTAFLALIKDQPPPADLLSLYRKKMELCEQPMLLYLGNVSRALGVLLELLATNKTWKVYMEGAVLDAKAKGRDFQTFLVMPRLHLTKLLTIMSPFECCKPAARALEQLETRCRNVSGKAAAEDAKNKPGIPGISKLKLPFPEFSERTTRRLVRDGKFMTQATGLGSGASKKKAKEAGYWCCDDCLLWGAVKGPVKSCVRFLQVQMTTERLDEGGFAIDLTDPGTGHSVSVVCADEAAKSIWESDLNDWIGYAIELDRRQRRDETERMHFEMEERARQEAERMRQMEIERQAVAARRAEEEKKAAERARLAEIERQERMRVEAEQAKIAEQQRKQEAERQRVIEQQRQEKMRQDAEKARQLESERVEAERARMAEVERQRQSDAAKQAAAMAAMPPPPALPPVRAPPPSSLPPPILSPGRGSGNPNLASPPPPLVAPPSFERVPTSPMVTNSPSLGRTNSHPTPSPSFQPMQPGVPPAALSPPMPALNRNNSGSMSTSMPSIVQLQSPGRNSSNQQVGAIPSATIRPVASPRSAAPAGRGSSVGAAVALPGSPVGSTTPKLSRGESGVVRRSDDGFAAPVVNSMLPQTESTGPRLPQARAEKPPPWGEKLQVSFLSFSNFSFFVSAATGGSSPTTGPPPAVPPLGWTASSPSLSSSGNYSVPLASPPSTPPASTAAGPRLPQARVEKPPPWETNANQGPRVPQKRTEAPPPWEVNK